MNDTTKRMKQLGWTGIVETVMTVHDVPFSDNPDELIPTEDELDTLRNGFDSWMEGQGKLP